MKYQENENDRPNFTNHPGMDIYRMVNNKDKE